MKIGLYVSLMLFFITACKKADNTLMKTISVGYINAGDSTSKKVTYYKVDNRTSRDPILLDINEDNIDDISFQVDGFLGTTASSFTAKISSLDGENDIFIGVDDQLNPLVLNDGEKINADLMYSKLISSGLTLQNRSRYYGPLYPPSSDTSGSWAGVKDKYLPFKLSTKFQVYYGWIKMDVDYYLHVKSYAYR